MCFITQTSLATHAVTLGLGRYPCDIDDANKPAIAFQGHTVGATFGMLAVVWSKTSFAITLLRLTDGKVRSLVVFIIAIMNAAMLLEALFTWINCTPVRRMWDPTVPGTCWNRPALNAYGVFAGSLSGVCDITLAMLAWQLVWNLKMQRKEKIGVGVAMSMGVL